MKHKWGTLIGQEFKLKDQFIKIPAFLHTALYKLFKHEIDKECLAYIFTTYTGDKWRILIPLQDRYQTYVSASESKYVCLITGNEFNGIPRGWILCGSIHSHSVFEAFFSGVDDISDFKLPGLHIVYGNLHKKDKPDIRASITWLEKRYIIDYARVIETNLIEADYHPKCLEYIKSTKTYKLSLKEKLGLQWNRLMNFVSKQINYCER